MKPQVKAGRKAHRTFFDRKVRHEGFSRTLSLGKIIPKNWLYVRIRKISEAHHKITVELTCLLEGIPNTQNTQTNKRRKQNT